MKLAICTLLLIAFAAGCRPAAGPPSLAVPPTRREIWQAIQPQAERYRMDPAFIYALVAAESNFNPGAANGSARGLLQIKPVAWRTVSALPYDEHVWDWRRNLEVGIDYLAYSRSYLHRKTEFSYPLLLASFHYGIDYVERRRFAIGRIPVPPNEIYRKLWAGNLAPLPPPE